MQAPTKSRERASQAPRRVETAPAESLPPFPEGWYFIATRKDVLKAKLMHKQWMGEDIVVWCDAEGNVCVADAFCPHMGSFLGPATGGCVRDGRLVCPFHGFQFDATGQCVETPLAPPPRTARLRVYETWEMAGMIFAWWGLNGRPPQWGLPETPEQDDWCSMRLSSRRFAGHPQDTTENAVDMAHLSYVHGYSNVESVLDIAVDEHIFEARFDFTRWKKVPGLATFSFDVSARVLAYGLGYSYVEVREHSIGVDTRLWVLATPVDGKLIDFTQVTQVKHLRKPKRFFLGLGFLPTKLRAPILNKFVENIQKVDVREDVVIWSRKKHRPRPRLSLADGKIMPFRAYCAQFYQDPNAPSE